MFENGFAQVYCSYDEYVRAEKAAGRKPVSFAKFMFGRY